MSLSLTLSKQDSDEQTEYYIIFVFHPINIQKYKKDGEQTLKKIYTFDSPVKALAANDIRAVHVEWGNPAVEWQPEHNGQLGVALEDGTFYIYEVLEKSEKRESQKYKFSSTSAHHPFYTGNTTTNFLPLSAQTVYC